MKIKITMLFLLPLLLSNIKYEIWRSVVNDPNTAIKIGESNEPNYTDYTVQHNVRYWYWIKAKNEYGTSGFSTGDCGYSSRGNYKPFIY